ncbi:hypothetical protein ACF061_00680 [Streptomyces sp. NPDC015220]|uniref:hypothetical protein n=1 Tax=Streptomyces sp. NPDC015220 TaxID=3364947 RepID=UPI0036F70DEC
MPAYLVIHPERHGDDQLIEDPDLAVEFVDGWVLFTDRGPDQPNRVAIAIPAAQVARIERVDDQQKPAPQPEGE